MTIQVFLFSMIFFLFSSNPVNGEDLRKIYKNTKVGQWVVSQLPEGITTRTSVVKKDGNILILEMKTIMEGNITNTIQSEIDLVQNRTISIMTKLPNGQVLRTPGDPARGEVPDYQFIGIETIRVPAGTFRCEHYRTTIGGKNVDTWISEEIPVNQTVKSIVTDISIELVEYGETGAVSEF